MFGIPWEMYPSVPPPLVEIQGIRETTRWRPVLDSPAMLLYPVSTIGIGGRGLESWLEIM